MGKELEKKEKTKTTNTRLNPSETHLKLIQRFNNFRIVATPFVAAVKVETDTKRQKQ